MQVGSAGPLGQLTVVFVFLQETKKIVPAAKKRYRSFFITTEKQKLSQ